jgi:hypothetical protein
MSDPLPGIPITRHTPRYRFLVPGGLLFVILGVGGMLVSAAPGTEGRRPFLALLHSAQSVQPHVLTLDNMTAFALLDPTTRLLSVSLSEGDVQLFWSLNGPAAPEENGPTLFGGQWSPGPLVIGPLGKAQINDLRRGMLYLEFAQPSALPEPPRALRGQLLPVPGVRY